MCLADRGGSVGPGEGAGRPCLFHLVIGGADDVAMGRKDGSDLVRGASVPTAERMRVVVAGAMLVVGGLFAVVTAPDMDAHVPLWVAVLIGSIVTVAGVLVLRLPDQFNERSQHYGLLLGAAVIVTTAALSEGVEGLAVGSGFMVWVVVYAACFLTLRQAVVHGLIAYAGLAVAVLHMQPAVAPLVVGGSFVNAVVVGACIGWMSERLRSAALLDPLTGVANARAWRDIVADEFDRADRTGQPLSVAFVDLDGLKELNDEEGHAAGDEAIASVATALQSGVRSIDVVARIGGDEFVVLLPDTEAAAAERALMRLRTGSPVSFSIGVAERAAGEGADSVLERADVAMYRMKRDRSGATRSVPCCVVVDPP